MRKRMIALIAGCLMISATQAMALPQLDAWQLDLSAYGAGTYTNIDNVVVSGSGIINQSFGSDHIFNDGDTFTEYSLLQSLTYWTDSTPSDFQVFSGLGSQKLYLYGTGLEGTVYNVTGSTLADTSFDYNFTPGKGTLGIYLDNDADPNNGTNATLATFSIVSPSGGQGPAGFLGGQGVNGTTDLTAVFTSFAPGVWKDSNGNPLEGYDIMFNLLNTHNLVTSTQIYGSFDQTGNFTPDGFISNVTSNGSLVPAVPEPSTFALLGAGLVGLGLYGRRRMKK